MAEEGTSSVPAGRGERGEADVNWESFSHWACCACVVTFDLELGQAMEVSEGTVRGSDGRVCLSV